MAQLAVDAAGASLVEAVRTAIPAVRHYHETNCGKVVPPEEASVPAALLEFLGALFAEGALDQRSKQTLTNLPVSNGELGELVISFKPGERPTILRQNGQPAEAFIPGAGGTSLLLLAVADRLAREVSAGNFWHEKNELYAAIQLLQDQGKKMQAERR